MLSIFVLFVCSLCLFVAKLAMELFGMAECLTLRSLD